jgi:hypothetical protein
MGVARLTQGSLEGFIRSHAAPDALWLFLHIPKTAGSSLSAELNEIRPPYRNIHLAEEDYRRTDVSGAAFWRLLDRHIDAFLADDRRIRYRSASGHMLAPQALRIAGAVPGTRLFTFLREPVARVVSDYRYQLSREHPAHAAFAAQYPTIESYLPTAEANKMHRHLALHPREPVDELVDRVGETFAFVGIVEMYPYSFNVLTRLFGDNRMPHRRERVAGPETRAAVAMTAALEARIAEINGRDLAIYRHFRRLLGAHRDSWLRLREAEVQTEASSAGA